MSTETQTTKAPGLGGGAAVRLIVLIAVVAAIWFVLALLESRAGQEALESLTAEGIQQVTVVDNRGRIETTQPEPQVIWLDFDEETVTERAAAKGGQRSAVSLATPREDIAALLDWIRREPVKPALMVFLDIGLPFPADPKAEARLVKALEAWNADPRAPPMAVYAGPACSPRSFATDPEHYFDPGPYDRVISPGRDGVRRPGAKIVWACPMFHGLQQDYWRCVTGLPDAKSPTLALPSPAWIATGVDKSRAAFAVSLDSGLAKADRICRGSGEPLRLEGDERPVPKLNRVRLTFDPLVPDGVPSRMSVGKILGARSFDTSKIQGQLVVVGASNTSAGGGDTITTHMGPVPGPVMVAAAVREGWLLGLPHRPPWWVGGWLATALALAASLALLVARRWRPRMRGLRGATKIAGLALTSPHVIAALFVPLSIVAILLAGSLLTGADVVRIGAVLFLLEWLFIAEGLIEEARHG